MKNWEEKKEPSGAVVHTLVFGHHGDDPKVIVALFRDSEGDWFTTSDVLLCKAQTYPNEKTVQLFRK